MGSADNPGKVLKDDMKRQVSSEVSEGGLPLFWEKGDCPLFPPVDSCYNLSRTKYGRNEEYKMQKLTYFYLKSCPYCRQADALLAELRAEYPKYADVTVEKIEEEERKEIADRYDYYYVPCFFLGEKKLFEGVPTKAEIQRVLEAAM